MKTDNCLHQNISGLQVAHDSIGNRIKVCRDCGQIVESTYIADVPFLNEDEIKNKIAELLLKNNKSIGGET